MRQAAEARPSICVGGDDASPSVLLYDLGLPGESWGTMMVNGSGADRPVEH
jgi:hypothetical protein